MAGRDRIDEQAVMRPLDGHRSGQAVERGLRRRIEAKALRGPAGGDAADIDDRPATPMVNRRARECARRVERADGVDSERALSLRSVRVDERPNGEKSRIVDENIGVAEGF